MITRAEVEVDEEVRGRRQSAGEQMETRVELAPVLKLWVPFVPLKLMLCVTGGVVNGNRETTYDKHTKHNDKTNPTNPISILLSITHSISPLLFVEVEPKLMCVRKERQWKKCPELQNKTLEVKKQRAKQAISA